MVGVVELAGYEGVLYKRGRREKKREERREWGGVVEEGGNVYLR